MGLFQRISDIISANLNDMTEGFEDPERMLKQAVREMEDSIAEATQETAKALANSKILAKELAANEQQAADWQKKAEQAVAAGDDNLARKALARKAEHQKLVTALQDQLNVTQDSCRTLKNQLEGMQAKLAEVEMTGQSGGGMVVATMNGKGELKSIKIDKSVVDPEDAEILEDLVVAAVSDAKAKIEAHVAGETQKMMGGVPMPPGMKLPF